MSNNSRSMSNIHLPQLESRASLGDKISRSNQDKNFTSAELLTQSQDLTRSSPGNGGLSSTLGNLNTITKGVSRIPSRERRMSGDSQGRIETSANRKPEDNEMATRSNILNYTSPHKRSNADGTTKREYSATRQRESTPVQKINENQNPTQIFQSTQNLDKTKVITNFAFKSRPGATSTKPQKVNHDTYPVSYTHLRAHETRHDLVCRLLLEKKNQQCSRRQSAGRESVVLER
eukprot:TRINITY_DN13799_c0_g1_i1.p1 TRINITY_DN13799_c0_g1~~TRINITY_DN13799_c0_g1_i1.p1  ORF type:complete len:233 (+),score=17.74 TRINITY_DN13799_c0_g1_i1:646-1344(+)